MARLGDIGKIITGNTPKTSEIENYSSNDICFIKPSDILESDITYVKDSEFYISELARDKARILPPQSILVTCIGIIGKVAINQVECAFNQQINAIIPNLNTCVPNYLAYAIQYKKNEIQGIANAAVVPILNKTQFSDIEVNLPQLDEQLKIAAVLDKLTNLISLRKQQLAKLDELVKARFVEMFGDLSINSMGWEFQKLSSLCDVRDGTHDSPEYQNEGYPLLTSKNFSSGIIDFSDCNLICEEDFEMINRRSKVDYGDIIMPMIGTIGHPVIVDTDRPFAIKNVALIKFNNKEISNIFVKTVLDSDYFLNVTTANNRGGTQKFIALGDIRNIPIPIVPKELQIEFADFVKEVDRQKLTIQQSLDKLEVLRKSLMQEYFG